MAHPGSETYKSIESAETLPRSTMPSESALPPEVIQGEDWPVAVPVLHELNPSTLPVPGPDASILVRGEGFGEESIIVWNEQDVETEYVNPGELRTLISMTAVGVDPVYVRNEDKHSNTLEFTFTEAAPEP